MFAQDGRPIVYAKGDQNLFILDVTIPEKIMQTNQFAMITTAQE